MNALVVLGVALLALIIGILIGVGHTSRRYQRTLDDSDITELTARRIRS